MVLQGDLQDVVKAWFDLFVSYFRIKIYMAFATYNIHSTITVH